MYYDLFNILFNAVCLVASSVVTRIKDTSNLSLRIKHIMGIFKKDIKYSGTSNLYVELKSIPKFSDLQARVDKIIANSSWWDLYGVDWAITFGFLCLLPASLFLLQSDSWPLFSVGVFLLGWIYHCLANKNGHIATHGGMARNKSLAGPLSTLFIEFIGSLSADLSYDVHIKEHHPYTNIIGRGDSSTWKVPFLPRYIYMFVAPVFLPPLALVLSVGGLLLKGAFLELVKYVLVCGSGLACQTLLLVKGSGLSVESSLVVLWISRGIFFIPYIHVNIFQHIGLPMYSQERKPTRLYQMTSGVLNLPRNLVLDTALGHSLISCHVEHHLFPKLSDNMCLKVKPVVSKFVKESGLPYNEKSYMDRLWLFLDQYEKLMVQAPPMTHFIGIQ